MEKWTFIGNVVVALCILIGYIVLTALHDDGSALLGILGGQGVAAVIGKSVKVANGILPK